MSRYVEILECGAKNFLRYGNSIVKFKIENGLTSISGKNGSGKSTIIEIIHYVFFGRSYRGINLDKLINNTNTKGLLAYVLIRVTENGHSDTYLIQRGIDPNIKKIFKNNSDKAEKVPTTFDNYISETLLGFNENTHKNIIAVSAGGAPFIKMTLDEKRKIIDNITNLSETKEYSKIAKNAVTECNSRVSVIESEIKIHTSSLAPYMEILQKNNSEIDTRISEISVSIVRNQNEISSIQLKIDEYSDELSELTSSLETVIEEENKLILEYNNNNPKKIQEEIIEHNSTLKYLKQKTTEKKNEISKIIPNVPCDHCGNCYSEDQANTKRAEKQLEIDQIILEGRQVKSKLDTVTALADSLTGQINKIKEAQAKKSEINYSIQAKKHDIHILTNNISHVQSAISRSNSEISRLESAKKDSETAMKAQDKIDIINLKIKELTEELGEINDKIEAYKYLIKMLSDEGIKAFILNKFLPILNKLINHYLKIFGIDITLEITSDYGYLMKSSNGLADEYEGLSGGQKQRINLSVLFAQTDLIKIMGNFKTNILFLDEYIDGAVDHEGLMDTLNMMKQISTRDNKSIVFISHRLDNTLVRDIDHFYMARKVDSDFSEFLKVDREDIVQIINEN